MSRPKVDPEIQNVIVRLWKNGAKTGPAIYNKLKKLIPSTAIPSIRTIQYIIEPLPVKTAEAEKEKNNPDRPWSLGATVNESWSANPEVIEVLLKICKWCKVMGASFSVREAKWIVFLRYLGGGREWGYNLHAAREYAAKEWACEMLTQTFDTLGLDAKYMFKTPWEYHAAIATGIIPQLQSHGDIDDLMGDWIGKTDLPDFAFEDPQEPIDISVNEIEANLFFLNEDYGDIRFSNAVKADAYVAKLKEIQIDELSPEEQVVYGLWLRKISDARIWSTLSLDLKLQAFEELRNAVRQGIKEQKEQRRSRPGGIVENWEPVEILKRFDLLSKSDTRHALWYNPEVTKVMAAYEQNRFGILAPSRIDVLLDACMDYSPAWVLDAINEAAEDNKRSLTYVQYLLITWRRRGKDDGQSGKRKI